MERASGRALGAQVVGPGASAVELKARLDKGEKPFLLDVRGPDEFEAMRLGIGETLLPLGALRRRLGELPAGKDAPVVCFCKISLRGYEAASILRANGWRNVGVLEGGIAAWPYGREKQGGPGAGDALDVCEERKAQRNG